MALTLDKTTGATTVPASGLDKHFVMHNYIDFTVTANQVANTEIVGLFDIPAHVMVEEVLMYVPTADANITDVDIGSYSSAGVAVSADGFHDGSSLASTGWIRDVSGEGYSPPTGYITTSAWIVGYVHNTAATLNEAKIHFYAKCIDYRDMATNI